MDMTERVLVVKLGGGAGLDIPAACADLASLAGQYALVVVHGVSAAMDQLCAERGVSVRTLTSPSGHTSRYTDPQTRDLFVEAASRVNEEIVSLLHAHRVAATGLLDPVVIHGERKRAVRAVIDGRTRIIRDDYSGSITGVDAAAIQARLQAGQTPVLPPLAASDEGLLNIDGDRASAAVAGALRAQELVILSNVRGLFRSFPDEASFVPEVPRTRMSEALGWAQGRMKRKVLGAQEAVENGVQRVIIGDGRAAQPVTRALAGEGTIFTC